MRSGGILVAGLLALTLTDCVDTGPTTPTGPFRLTMLTAFGSSSGPVYNGVTYQSYAYDIDPAGQVVGKAESPQTADIHYPVLWPADGAPPIRLEANGDGLFTAYGINGRGQVVGLCGGQANACMWGSGQLSALPSLPYTYPGSQPLAINDSGVAVGWSYAPDGFDHAVFWRNGVTTDLGTLGGLQSEALNIDNEGRIVGWARPPSGTRHGFLWQNGTMMDLDSTDPGESIAYAINDSGVIVGRVGGTGGRAVMWQNGQMTFLPGSEPSQAFGINNRGEVVGTYIPSGTTFHAALWRDGVRYDLNDLVADRQLGLHWANAINDAGQIVGFGVWKSDGREVGFLLTPTGTH